MVTNTTDGHRIIFATNAAGYTINAVVERQTLDLLIQIEGGDVAHYGVVTTVQPSGAAQTISLPSRPGHVHQEGVMTRIMAAEIQPALQGNAIIVSGMHVNNISPDQMRAAIPMVQELGRAISGWIKANPAVKPTTTYAPGQHV